MIVKNNKAHLVQATALALTMGVASAPVSARAQTVPAKTSAIPDEDEGGPDIIVTAPHIDGAVVADIPPELELDEAAVESYGASSISELLDALAPQTTSGRGRG